VILELVRPWFERVEFSNAKDRALRRGEGKQARAGREPALTAAQVRAMGQRIEAGTARWEGVERILRPLGLLAWGSADGKTLVVASPNYTQAPQYEFFETVQNGSNVTRLSLTKSTTSRYAQIVVSGSGRPLRVSAPTVQTPAGQQRAEEVRGNRVAMALDNPGSKDGTGLDFLHPKRLFLATEGLTIEEAQREAERALARGRARAREVEVTVPGHGVVLDGAHQTTLYAPDTVATVYKEIEAAPGDDTPQTIVDTNFYVTRVNYQGTREGGESTSLSLVPLESLLV
jgi:prophage tail gpP-like protein